MISREVFCGGRESKKITSKGAGSCGGQNTILKPGHYILRHFSLKYPFIKIATIIEIKLQIKVF